ncbi:9858_t:CDS:10 [Rhizophagus irregularis]|nr:9858_t:CDS:10 [Rhizophagus irregularis]
METQIFPLLALADVDGLSYRGFITIKGQELPFEIQLENVKTLKNAKLHGSPELKRLLFGHEKALKQRLEQCSSLTEFFVDLKDLLERIITKEKREPMPDESYYSKLLSELDTVGWDKLESIDPSLKSLTLILNDSSGRKHKIYISLSFSYPQTPLTVQIDLPSSASKMSNPTINFNDIISFYSKEVEKFQEVWSMLDDIDANTWVLEPDKPKRSDMSRRIALGNHCSLFIKLDEFNPKKLCDYTLFGAESFITPLRTNIAKNFNNWDLLLSIRQNLEKILEINFPSPEESSDFNVACGICYAYRLDDVIPDQTCSNAKCGQPFHQVCLYEWLRAIPSTTQTFNRLRGDCPYCNDSFNNFKSFVMASDRSDNESDADAFVDASDTFVEDVEGKPTSYRYSTAILSSLARNAGGIVSMFSSSSDNKELTSQNNSRDIPKDEFSAVPEISITDMSNGDGDDEYNDKQLIESDDASSVNTDIPQNDNKDSITNNSSDNNEPIDVTVYVKDLDTGKNIPASYLEEEIKKSNNGNIDPLSFHILKRSGSLNEYQYEHKRKDDSDDEGGKRNNAPVFGTETPGSDFGRAQPRYIKVKTRHKHFKEFDKLFLAQELCLATQNETSGAIWTMKFSKDGKFLATGGQDTVVRVWAVISSDEEREHFLEGNGTSVYEGSKGSKLGAPVFRDKPLYEYLGHTADVLDLSWSKNDFLLSSSMDKTVRLWHITRKECLCCFQHTDFVTAIAFHPKDDRFFLSGSLDCKLRLWNIPEKRVAHWNEVPNQQLITAVGFTLDGKMSVAGSFSGLCLFYETDGLKYNTQIHVKSSRGKNSQGKKITGIEAMPGTKPGQDKLLISSNDSRIRLYNMRDKSLECKYKGYENTCSQIRATFSDDGRYIISGSEDRHVYILNANQSQLNAQYGNSGGNNWLKKDKIGYESFEAHSAIVTVAIFAPTRTKQLIALYCAYYYSRDNDSHSVRSTRSWNSNIGNSLGNFFSKPKQNKSSVWNSGRRKSDASMHSVASSVMSDDIDNDGNKFEENYSK